MKKEIKSSNAPEAIGTYSQAIATESLLFISGQIPLDPKTMNIVDGIENQIRQTFLNVENILKEENLAFENVIKLTILLDDLDNFELVNEVMTDLFQKPYPARAAYEVSKLPKNSSIEIETIAVKIL
ncbi:MAG: Rid family detoxifying hydrolase [Gammaproteobacteria bacterium]